MTENRSTGNNKQNHTGRPQPIFDGFKRFSNAKLSSDHADKQRAERPEHERQRHPGCEVRRRPVVSEVVDVEAVEVGRHPSKKAAVTAALMEYVKARRRLGILDFVGRVDYYDDYDHKNLRRNGSA